MKRTEIKSQLVSGPIAAAPAVIARLTYAKTIASIDQSCASSINTGSPVATGNGVTSGCIVTESTEPGKLAV